MSDAAEIRHEGGEAVQLRPVSPLALELRRCAPWILEALAQEGHDDLTPVVAAVMGGHAQLWPGERSCMVTKVYQGPPATLHVWLGAGDLEELISMQPAMKAWGRAMGCTEVTIEGRAGWGRALKASGWAVKYTVYGLKL